MKMITRFFSPDNSHFKILLLSAILFLSGTVSAQDGEALFKANCASCHKLNKKLVGPALAGVQDRWEDEENLIAWIKNSQAYMDETGDPYAIALFEEYNKSIMPAQAVNDEEIKAILAYIANPPVEEKPKEVVAAPTAEKEGDDYSSYWLLAFAILFIIIIRVLFGVSKSVKKLTAEVDGKTYEGNEGFFDSVKVWVGNHKKATAGIGLVLLAVLAMQAWYAAKGIGVYQAYAPEQPIKFSHKIHAGENGISCVYCHHSAEKGKSAGIPSVNVCMNCHTAIGEGKRWGTEEIAKIYEAAGYDPDAGAYTKEQKPIKWVRIHNLPDFAYFNHSQHVVVGKQECQTCHGEVENIDYPMKQHAELTMGRCINCHRETEVKMEGNGYYDKLHAQLLEQYADEGIEKFTVEHIGGLECAKCHY